MFGFGTKRLVIEEQRRKIAQLQEELYRKERVEIKPTINEHFVKQLTQLADTVIDHGNGLKNHKDHLLSMEASIRDLRMSLTEVRDRGKTFVEETTKRLNILEHLLKGSTLNRQATYQELQNVEKSLMAFAESLVEPVQKRVNKLESRTGHTVVDHEVLVKLTDVLDIDVVPRNAAEQVDLVPRTKKGNGKC